MKYADLHIHTTASDGILDPREVVAWAKKISLTAISITDHDTTCGLNDAIDEGDRIGLEIIPGIELGTYANDYEIHILGYFIDYNQPQFQKELELLRVERNSRAQKMILKLKDIYGINLDMDYLKSIAGNAAISRPHIGRALIELGIVTDLHEAFDIYIGNKCPAYVPRSTLSPKEGIELIEEYGGIPILAHPGLIGNMDIVEQIIQMGIEGIEVFYPQHTAHQVGTLIDICHRNQLLMTGGSDFHDEFINNIPAIGKQKLPYTYVEFLKKSRKS